MPEATNLAAVSSAEGGGMAEESVFTALVSRPGHSRVSVHEERIKGRVAEDGVAQAAGLAHEFAAEGGAPACLLAAKLALHAFFEADMEAVAPFLIEIDAAFARLEMRAAILRSNSFLRGFCMRLSCGHFCELINIGLLCGEQGGDDPAAVVILTCILYCHNCPFSACNFPEHLTIFSKGGNLGFESFDDFFH
jgi:hypothetical protein